MEAVAWVLRVHPEADAVLPDPYIASATVTIDDSGIATIRGYSGQMDGSAAVARAFFDVGIREAIWSRMVGGQRRHVRVRIVKRDGGARFERVAMPFVPETALHPSFSTELARLIKQFPVTSPERKIEVLLQAARNLGHSQSILPPMADDPT